VNYTASLLTLKRGGVPNSKRIDLKKRGYRKTILEKIRDGGGGKTDSALKMMTPCLQIFGHWVASVLTSERKAPGRRTVKEKSRGQETPRPQKKS